MIPRFKYQERLLCYLLFRYEARHVGGGFYKLNMEAAKWLMDNNYMSFREICSLIRDCGWNVRGLSERR